MDGIDKHQIISDMEKICEYIGLWDTPLIIFCGGSEGLTCTNKEYKFKYFYFGVEKGYKRKLLIHELIHCLCNINHTYPSDFFTATYPKDELSGFIENRLFNND